VGFVNTVFVQLWSKIVGLTMPSFTEEHN